MNGAFLEIKTEHFRCLKYIFYGKYNEAYETLQKHLNSLASSEVL